MIPKLALKSGKEGPERRQFQRISRTHQTFEDFEDNILNFFDSCGLTNAQTECVKSWIIITNRSGRGYDLKTLRLKLLCRRQAVINAMSHDVEYEANIVPLVNSVGQNAAFDEGALLMTSINFDYEKRCQDLVEATDAFGKLERLEDELTGVKYRSALISRTPASKPPHLSSHSIAFHSSLSASLCIVKPTATVIFA